MNIRCYNPQLTEDDRMELVQGLSDHSLRIYFESTDDKRIFAEEIQDAGFSLSGLSGDHSPDGEWADVYTGSITEYNNLSDYINKYYEVSVIPSTQYDMKWVVDDELYDAEKLISGKAIPEKNPSEKQGYTFSWENPIRYMQAMNYTMKGKYMPNQHTITYMVDGNVHQTQTVGYNQPITVIDDPVKEGYTFSGWSELPKVMPDKNLTCVGTFEPIDYTLTYNSDGQVYTTQTYHVDDSITLPEPPTKEGCVFLGWFEMPKKMPANDVTVNAVWSVAVAEE